MVPSISGHGDPDGEAPWAMQLVARIEKVDRPTRSDVLAAAATAVATLLADPRCQPGGEFAASVERWLDGRIRKHCRRARGADWRRVQDVAGVTVAVGSAEVRAFVPEPTDAIDRRIAKLQLSGSELDDPDADDLIDPEPGGPLVISISPSPPLAVGKAAAAAGHAAQVAMAEMPPARLARWHADGLPVRIEHPSPARWAELRAVAPVVIVDAGFTDVDPGTVTALARWA